ncbi:MAG: hypothetical protein ACRDSJ_16030 [Rubrobacteraceae bacterium]
MGTRPPRQAAVRTSWSEGLGRREGNPLGVEVRRFGDTTAFVARGTDDPYRNRIMRVAADHTSCLEEAVSWRRSQGVECRVEVVPHLADEGRIIEKGRHADLVNGHGLYRKLHDRRFGGTAA